MENKFGMNKQYLKLFLGLISLLFSILGTTSVSYADTTVLDDKQLVSALTKTGDETISLLQNITLNERVDIVGNKTIDLNNKVLILGEGASDTGKVGKMYLNRPDNQQFTIKNGRISGGDTRGLASHASAIGAISVGNKANANLVTTAQDISHTSKGGFYKGKESKIVFKGKVTLENDQFNVRAKNMDFYGNPQNSNDSENVDFYGYTSADGDPIDTSTANGGLNLSFDGYESFLGPNQRILNINKNAKVKLKNDNNTILNYRAYANNIANFAVINLDGILETEAIGTTLRTTSSRYDTGGSGTTSGQAELNINPGATFKTISTATTYTYYGTIFTYSLDINVNNPLVFDIRFFGTGQFFYSWPNRGGSNFHIRNADVAVWNKDKKGIGNPNDIWQDVLFVDIKNFTNTGNPKATSSNPNLANNFTINNYSRISNDIKLPIILPDKEFQSAEKTVLKNNATTFYGSTDYYLPDGTLVGQSSPGAMLTLDVSGKKYTTVADEKGDWKFENINISNVSGGTIAKLDLVDVDKRIAKTIPVVIEDKTPPKAAPKLIKAKLNDMTNLINPKDAFASYGDETTSDAQLKFEYVTSLEDRQEMVKKVGKYEVEAKVTDAAGNATTIKAPVIVHEPTEIITNGFVSGNDFEVDYDKWTSATDSEKRAIMLAVEYGNVKGFEIQGNDVTEVTTNSSKMTMSFSGFNWEPKKTYEIQVKVLSYTKKIKVTLVPAAVKMTPKQVYEGTNTAIFEDLSQNTTVDNSKAYDVKIGDPLSQVIDDLIAKDNLNLDRKGYNKVEPVDYRVKVNNQIIQTDKVPDQPFELVFDYVGQMKFEQAPSLDFGKIEISKANTQNELASTSQDQVKIINTLLKYDWTLKASTPKGIKSSNSQENFLGQLLYYDENGDKHVIDHAGTKLTSQKSTDKSLSTVNVRGKNDSGMRLEQHVGNNKDTYSGELEWSLEDVPK